MKWLRAAYFCVRGKTSFAASRLAPSEDAQDRDSTGLTADDGDWQRRISAPSAEVPGPRRRGGTRCRNQGSSVAEQLIRKQPQVPTDRTQHDATPGNQTQEP